MTELLQQLWTWSVWLVDTLGYLGILFLMTLESSVFPVPSELVMPQAGYLVAEGKMNMTIVILMGIIGSCLGALLNYFVALKLGRPFFLKYGKYFFCGPHTFAKLERFFLTHGEVGTFTGRLVPVVRHGISIPAGIAKMKMKRFLFFTALGSGIWVTILAVIGYIAGKNTALIKKYCHEATIWVVVGCIVVALGYIWWHKRRVRKQDEESGTAGQE